MNTTAIVTGALLTPFLLSQDLRWQVPSAAPSVDIFLQVAPFTDWDGDGYRDLLVRPILNAGVTGASYAPQIRSGRDGSVLWQRLDYYCVSVAAAGDVDGDQSPDIAMVKAIGAVSQRFIEVWSPATNQVLWQTSVYPYGIGYSMVGDFDVDGDDRSELAAVLNDTSGSFLFVYNSNGSTRYSIDTIAGYGGVAVSVGKMPDMDSDGHDDLLLGVNDASRGKVLLVSGNTGAVLRQHQGQMPGDKTCDFVSDMGDLDGDGVHDYAAFPWITAASANVMVWSGATGQLLRTWNEFGNSVIAGEDFDRDGVPDLAIGADWLISPNVYGSTRVYSGRDGALLWRINNAPFQPFGQGSQGFYGWMEYSASLGTQPGDAYPTLAWIDVDWIMVGTERGRIRAYRTNFVGQGRVHGKACSTGSQLPLIGLRRQPLMSNQNLARMTLARAHSGAAAWLLFGQPNQVGSTDRLPVDLTPFGLPGCQLQVRPFTSRFTTLGATGVNAGYGYVDLANSFAPTLGTVLAAQWIWFDPTTLDHGVSEVHELRIQ